MSKNENKNFGLGVATFGNLSIRMGGAGAVRAGHAHTSKY
jgi:hypothetical protein